MSSDKWPHTGAILAGGQSRRMGVPKAGVSLWDGRPMIGHVLDTMIDVCANVVVVGECQGYELSPDKSVAQLQDIHPGRGPLSGLEALLSSGLDSRYLVISCDQPLIPPKLLYRLTEQSRPDVLTFFRSSAGVPLDPFPGVFPAGFLQVVLVQMQAGHYGLRDLISHQPVMWVDIPDSEVFRLKSINTPEDLDSVKESILF